MKDYIPLFITIITCISSLGAAILSYLSHKQSIQTGNRMNSLEENTNSKMDQLLAVTKISAHAAGVLEEKSRYEHP